MENNIKLNLRELGNRRVKIEVDQFSKLPSIEDYKRYIANLLGIYNTDNEKLKDEFNNADLGDGFLLYNELKKMDSSKYREVVFSGVNGDLIVNSEKGKQYIEKNKILNETINFKAKIKDIVKYNPSLISSVKMEHNRFETFNSIENNTIALISKYNKEYALKKELDEIVELNDKKINSLQNENIVLADELKGIYNSKRWKLVNKLASVKNMLRRK